MGVFSTNVFRGRLLAGTAIVAVAAVVGFSGQAMAVDATNEVVNAGSITGATVAGLLESNETGTVTVTINTGGSATIGANAGKDAVTITESTGATALVLNATEGTSGTTITWAEDIVLNGNASDTLVINHTDTSAVFDGNITVTTGSSVTINAGDSAADPTILLTFDTTANENQVIDAVINAVDAADTVNITIRNTDDSAGNSTTFSQAVGGTTAANAIDAILIDADTGDEEVTAIFSSTVNTGTFTVTADATANKAAAGTIVGNLTASGAVTLTAAITAASTLELQGTTVSAGSFSLNDDTGLATLTLNSTGGVMSVTGAIDGAASGEGTLVIKDDDAGAAGDLVTVVSAVGATTNKLLAINVGSATEAGNAQFQAAVSATTITLLGGNDAAETATAEFQNAITATTIVLNDATGVTTLTVNATNGAQTVAGAINGGSAGEGTLAVIDDDASAAPDAITFSGVVGGTKVGAITIGNSTQGGSAIFTSANAVIADTVTVTGGDNAAEDSVVQFQDALTATSLTLNDGTGDATANFNLTNGAQTIAGTIDGSASGEGTIGIYDDDSGESNLATFSGAVGVTSSLKAINIGTSTQGGDASFASTVDATTVTILGGDAANENAGGVFVGDATITTLNLTGGGNASADATAEFQAALSTTTITLDDATGQAELKINSTNGAQTVSGAIDGASSGEGKLIVIDDDGGAAAEAITFSGNVGSTNKLLAVEVGTAAGAAEAASAVFSGTVDATTVTLTAGNAALETALATFTGDLTVTTLALVGGGNSSADATATITGNLTGAVTMNDVTGQTALDFNGTAAQTVSGTVTANASGEGALTVSNTGGTVTFSSALGAVGNELGTVTLNASSTTVFSSTADVGDLDISGTKVTFNGAVTVDAGGAGTGTLNIANNATIKVGTGFASGDTVITADGTVADGAAVAIEMPSDLGNGDTLVIFDGVGGTTDGAYTATNTGLFTYASTVSDGTDKVTITVTKRSTSAIASTLGISTDEANALDNGNTAVATGDATALAALNSALNTGGATATKAAETMALQADTLGAGSAAAISTGGQVIGVAFSRLAMMRTGMGGQYAAVDQTGFASGDEALSNAGWIKPFGNWIRQGTRKGIKGFDADTYGISGGIDGQFTNKSRLGASFTYSNTSVDGKGAGNSQTDTDSYQLTVYGDYTTSNYYVEGSLGFARNRNDTSRTITIAGLQRTAKGSYDANQYMASVSAGMPVNIKGDTFFTPTAGVSWTHLATDNYTETGAGNLNQDVNPDSVDSVLLAVGGKIHTKVKYGKGYLVPVLSAGLSYDAAGDEATATSTYTGGGAAFSTTGAEVEQFGGNVGAGLTYDDGAWSVGAAYNLDVKSDYRSHSGTIEARWKF